METKVIKGNKSNYEINFILTDEEFWKYENKILKDFSKNMDVKWFRKWHIPLNIIKEKVEPEHIKVYLYEEVINKWITELLNEWKYKFIWQPYDINFKKNEKKWNVVICRMDVYPEVIEKNKNWETTKMWKIDIKINNDEINKAIESLKMNFADYKKTDKIVEGTTSKVLLEYLDKDGNVKTKKPIYVWKIEFEKDEAYKDMFLNKKEKEVFEIKYDEKNIFDELKLKKEEKVWIKTIRITVENITEIIYPDLDDEKTLKKILKSDDIKDKKWLLKFIEETLYANKEQQELLKEVDWYLKKIAKDSFEIEIPKTFVEMEVENKVKRLQEQYWWKENFEKYMQSMEKEKREDFLETLFLSSEEWLKKYFIFAKISELLKLWIDFQKVQWFEAEKKLYDTVMWKKKTLDKNKNEKKEVKKNVKSQKTSSKKTSK